MNRDNMVAASIFHRYGLVSDNTYVELSDDGYPVAIYIKYGDEFEQYQWSDEIVTIYIRGKRFERDHHGAWRAHDVVWVDHGEENS